MAGTRHVQLAVCMAVFASVLGAFGEETWGRTARDERPNIVWIMADDLGYAELGCYGQQVIRTPHIDRLAAEGMLFRQFYAGATVCAPSRSVLMTGLHQGHTRVRGNAGRNNPKAQALREEDITVATLLQRAGYATALIGKWGLGDVGPADSGLPRKHGFDYFFGYLNQSHAHNHFPSFLWRNEQKISLPNGIVAVGETGAGYCEDPVVFADDLFIDEVLKFIARHQNQPFFVYWNPVIPHANNERTRALGNGAHVPDFGPYALTDWPEQDKGHAAMITRLDRYVGRLCMLLEELGLAEKTIVIFTSDNGPHNESGHNLSRFRPSGPLRGIKRSLTEGGIRVPFIVRWKGHVSPGISEHVGYFGDFMATACELAGTEPPTVHDSISFVPTLLGRPGDQRQHEFLYWEFHERGFSQAVLYQGRWKAIRERSSQAEIELYDLQNDIGEQKNIAKQHPDIVAKIEQYLTTARWESEDWPIRTQEPSVRN